MITIRPERTDDLASIQEVDAAARASLREIYRPSREALINKSRMGPHLRRLVAIIDGRVVGTVQYHVDGHSLGVVGLGVHPDVRRRGAARSLVRWLREIALNERADRLHLYTVKETGNVEIFEGLGFTVISEREDEFSESDRFDKLIAVEMEMRLP